MGNHTHATFKACNIYGLIYISRIWSRKPSDDDASVTSNGQAARACTITRMRVHAAWSGDRSRVCRLRATTHHDDDDAECVRCMRIACVLAYAAYIVCLFYEYNYGTSSRRVRILPLMPPPRSASTELPPQQHQREREGERYVEDTDDDGGRY